MIPSLRNDLSDIFDIDRFFNQPLWESPLFDGKRYARVPAANIRETDEEYFIELDAPGLSKKDFEVGVDNGVLEIKVEKEEEREREREDYTRKEFNYAAFYRSFTLPETVNTDKIEAEYENGILSVRLPKLAEAKRKRTVKEIEVA